MSTAPLGNPDAATECTPLPSLADGQDRVIIRRANPADAGTVHDLVLEVVATWVQQAYRRAIATEAEQDR